MVSHNCFARNTHTYLDLDAGRDFDSQVVVKVNAAELLRRELAAPKWRGEHIAMGTNVDVYQRAEGRYRLMPGILAALRDFANPFSILTKGTLILRDLPLLRQAADGHAGRSRRISIGFLDEELWRRGRAGHAQPAPAPRRGARASPTPASRSGVLMAPILPGLTDTDESIDADGRRHRRGRRRLRDPLPLHLRPGAREWYATWLAREFPELVPRYRELYRRRLLPTEDLPGGGDRAGTDGRAPPWPRARRARGGQTARTTRAGPTGHRAAHPPVALPPG